MPIKDDNSKVIVSLLAGATAGIITGLLLAPETGEETRKSLAEEADKLLQSPLLSKVKEALGRFAPPSPAADQHPGQQAAEARLNLPAAPASHGRSVEGHEESEFADRRS